jgi:hypothetical protein
MLDFGECDRDPGDALLPCPPCELGAGKQDFHHGANRVLRPHRGNGPASGSLWGLAARIKHDTLKR